MKILLRIDSRDGKRCHRAEMEYTTHGDFSICFTIEVWFEIVARERIVRRLVVTSVAATEARALLPLFSHTLTEFEQRAAQIWLTYRVRSDAALRPAIAKAIDSKLVELSASSETFLECFPCH